MIVFKDFFFFFFSTISLGMDFKVAEEKKPQKKPGEAGRKEDEAERKVILLKDIYRSF